MIHFGHRRTRRSGLQYAGDYARAIIGADQRGIDPGFSRMEVCVMIYELRVYQPVPGQMPKLLARFRDKLLPIWEKNTLSDTQIKALDQVVDWWLCLPEYPRLHLGSYFVGSNPGLDLFKNVPDGS